MAGSVASAAPRVAVLMGGLSAEREVSLSSGRECAQALRTAGYEVIEVDAGRDLCARLSEIKAESASTPCMAAGARTAVCRACWSG